MSRRSQARAEARRAAQSARRQRRRPDRMLVSAIMLFFFTAFLLVSFNGELEWEGFALAVIVLFFVFAVRIITVSGVSMQPTLYGGDRVAVQSMLYTPQRGDVVVVDGYINYGDPLVKRIIALGGDTVDINFETGAVTLNGAVLEEPYISAPTTTGYDVEFPVTVPEGCVFVMGDNRPRSLDGRSTEVGFIDERDILGKVLLRVFPLSSFGKIA